MVPEEHAQVVEQFVALLDGSPDSPEQLPQQQEQHVGGSGNRLHTVRPGTAPAAATSHHGQQQQQARSPSAKRIGSASRNADLDWDEFIDRQSRFLSRREAKVAAVAANESRKPTCPEVRHNRRKGRAAAVCDLWVCSLQRVRCVDEAAPLGSLLLL